VRQDIPLGSFREQRSYGKGRTGMRISTLSHKVGQEEKELTSVRIRVSELLHLAFSLVQ
jgi:hypothetical protein